MEDLDAKGIAEFERRLTIPPPMTKIDKDDSIWGAEAEMAIFRNAAKPR